jgi:hypothetical protein
MYVFSFRPGPLHIREKSPSTIEYETEWDESRSGQLGERKNFLPCRESNPNLSVHNLIAVRLQTQNNLVITTSVYTTLRL